MPAEDLLKILISLLIGGAIGAERQFRDKAAGFRTVILICLGSTLFTIMSVRMAGGYDPARIAANVVVGIGFLGAGVILRHHGRIVGLTTASTVWIAAALGMGVGHGEYVLCAAAALAVLLVLLCFPRLEQMMGRSAEFATYEVVAYVDPELSGRLASLFSSEALRVVESRQAKHGERMTCSFRVLGNHDHHEALRGHLLRDPQILEFRTI